MLPPLLLAEPKGGFARRARRKKIVGYRRTFDALAAFVAEMGHQHEHLLEGATDEEGSEDDAPLETALLAANARIRDCWKTEEEGSESEIESGSDSA